MNELAEPGCVPVKCWTDGVPLEDAARAQLLRVAALPVVGPHVAVMPDVHWGMGATVGSVIPQRAAIIPAAVGVDIGCGMIAVKTTLTDADLDGRAPAIRAAIERAVPVGGPGVRGSWNERGRTVPSSVLTCWDHELAAAYATILGKHPRLRERPTAEQLGTLGTGNHFIEVCRDEGAAIWFMLHSGSRGVGNRIGTYFIAKAKEQALRLYRQVDADADLAWLDEGTPEFDDYVEAVGWAQRYARKNRALMMDRVAGAVRETVDRGFSFVGTAVNCHHNYVERYALPGGQPWSETHLWLTRKGAVSARNGELGIIPGSMGAKSFIVCGRGNPESFQSCSHGAGRAMSRGQARRTFTTADHAAATEGVECRKDKDVLDETPGAYKDVEAVMRAQADLVDVVATLKQLVCVKG